MPEFVSRNVREERHEGYEALVSLDGPKPNYMYVRVAKILDNFPIQNYAGPGVVAFMNPETLDVAMPSNEKTPYWSRDHVLRHETKHVYAAKAKTEHNEAGFNEQAVEELRYTSGHNFYPFPSYRRAA